MKFKAKIDYVKVKQITDAQIKASMQTAEKLRSDLIKTRTMPFLEGHMQNEDTEVDGKEVKKGRIHISTDAPQAARLYYHPEYNFTKTRNQSAGGKWWEPWLTGEKKKYAKQIFQFFYKKEAGI